MRLGVENMNAWPLRERWREMRGKGWNRRLGHRVWMGPGRQGHERVVVNYQFHYLYLLLMLMP
jgi:hypothetical protein